MPYSIDRYNGTTIAVVEDGTIDTTTDIKLIGKNYAGYGEVQNENLVHMLEHFSSSSAPSRPLSGQIWYDSANKKLKFYDQSKWRTTGGAEIASVAPTGLTVGDFWWDTANDQLYAWDGAGFVLVGPQAATGSGTTQMRSKSVRDVTNQAHAIIEAVVDEDVIYIISADAFTLDSIVNPITGFSEIKQGLTLVNTPSSGITSGPQRFWGTATNAERLNGIDASNFVSANTAQFTAVARFSDSGLTVGDSNDLEISVIGDIGYIKNTVGSKILLQTTSSGTKTPIVLDGADFYPNVAGLSNIGSNSNRYDTVFASTFNGTATQSNSLLVNGSYRSATTTISAGQETVAARTTAGDIFATLFRGTATAARFADLAEKYLPDSEYAPGTVVMVGGEHEVTASKQGKKALGVVSSNPAIMMNSELEGGIYVALKGRVPVKVKGSVKKGDYLIPENNGVAVVSEVNTIEVFAISLENSEQEDIKLVECAII